MEEVKFTSSIYFTSEWCLLTGGNMYLTGWTDTDSNTTFITQNSNHSFMLGFRLNFTGTFRKHRMQQIMFHIDFITKWWWNGKSKVFPSFFVTNTVKSDNRTRETNDLAKSATACYYSFKTKSVLKLLLTYLPVWPAVEPVGVSLSAYLKIHWLQFTYNLSVFIAWCTTIKEGHVMYYTHTTHSSSQVCDITLANRSLSSEPTTHTNTRITLPSGVARGGATGAAAPPNRFSHKKISHQYYDKIPEKGL
jgi:hypothetical protein